MTVLRTIVQASMPAMLDAGHDLSLGCAIAGQLVRDHHAWSGALLLEQLAEQPLGGLCVTPALN